MIWTCLKRWPPLVLLSPSVTISLIKSTYYCYWFYAERIGQGFCDVIRGFPISVNLTFCQHNQVFYHVNLFVTNLTVFCWTFSSCIFLSGKGPKLSIIFENRLDCCCVGCYVDFGGTPLEFCLKDPNTVIRLLIGWIFLTTTSTRLRSPLRKPL